MCAANKRFFGYLLLALLLVSALAALRAEEPPEPWYLIRESELRTIEKYREASERERQIWLLQVRELRMRAGSLEAASENLNRQLARAREEQRRLEQSFNGLEAEWLTRLSSKNGEIAGLNQKLADKARETETYKGKAALRLALLIAIGTAAAGYAAFRLARFLHVIPH
jgi:predicted RNase H-like nuclease (RuvC/YqgF family)